MNPPRPKRGRRKGPHPPPFPVPIRTLVGHLPTDADWTMCEGRLHGNAVVVSDPQQKETLFYSGFFGKGSLSRGLASIDQHPADKVRIMSKRVYEYHQSWKDISGDASTSSRQVTSKNSETDVQVLVKEDSDDEIPRSEPAANGEEEARLDSRSDPHPLTESLYLTTMEAFFLSFGLGCLLVMDKDKKYLNLEEMWVRYRALDPLFVYKYVAYHHFRSKGWVVRSGIKFGVDYLLYKEGPSFYHSSYSVIVKPVNADNFQPVTGTLMRPSSWSDLAGINRINEHAAKELMYCYIIQPSELGIRDLMCPTCISRFKVQEQLVQRWVASKERESVEALSD